MLNILTSLGKVLGREVSFVGSEKAARALSSNTGLQVLTSTAEHEMAARARKRPSRAVLPSRI